MSVSCDLTKLHEKTLRGAPAEVLEQLRANPKTEKGEYCLVIDLHTVSHHDEKPQAAPLTLEQRLTDKVLQGLSLREAQEAIALEGEKKNAVKAAALRLKQAWAEA